MKGLRGTMFDIFGKTSERRQERALVQNYIEMIEEFTQTLTPARLAVAIELARLPDDIRGFGHVKERNLKAVLERRSELLQSYRDPKPRVQATA